MPIGRGRAEIDALRESLQAEHARIVANLQAGHDRLKIVRQLGETPDADALLHAYKALITMVERENFITMPVERVPVVVLQITARLERLEQRLQATPPVEGPRVRRLLH